MQIKNSIVLLTISVLFLFIFNQNLTADEFDISAIEITVDKKNNIVVGKGSVEVIDRDGKIIK